MKILYLLILFAATVFSQAPSDVALHNVQFLVRLTSPLSTKGARAGDSFTAVVVEPAPFSGGEVEGHISKVVRPHRGRGKGRAELQFQFDRLTVHGSTRAISSVVKDVKNSTGVRKVDDEGRVIGVTSNKKRVASAILGSAVGATIGAAVAGGTGALAGAGAGAAAGLLIGVKMTTAGRDIRFGPGSTFLLSVSDRRSARRKK